MVKSKAGLETYAALLRGINVGGNHPVPMADLRVCFQGMGFRDVTTYINSGNVIFRAPRADPLKLEKAIEAGLLEAFGFAISVVVRGLGQMERLLERIPESWRTDTDQKCNVIFLRRAIDRPEILRELNPKPGIEELHYRPGVLFWSAPTSNLTKSNMIRLSASPLYQEMTVRILNSARKIHELMRKTAALPEG